MFGRLEALEAENLENADYSNKYLLCHKTDIFNDPGGDTSFEWKERFCVFLTRGNKN